LKHVEREAGYREVLENCIRNILELSGRDLLRKIKWFEAILFITSPNRVTEYHLDREVSWILQIQGDKEIHLFDRQTRTSFLTRNSRATGPPTIVLRATNRNTNPGPWFIT